MPRPRCATPSTSPSTPSSGAIKRYWIAEHHFVAVASSSPAVLIGQIAAATDTHSRRRRRGAARPHHRRRGRRELRHARRVPSRPHRPRRRAGPGSAAARRSRSRSQAEAEAQAADGMARRRRSGRPAAVRHARADANTDGCGRRCRSCSSPRRCRPTSADQVDDILAMLDGSYAVGDCRRARRARRTSRV